MKGPVIFDKKDYSIRFNLPEEALAYSNELGNYLQDVFAFEGLDNRTVKAMNRAASEWLKQKGIQADWDNSKENTDGNQE